MFDGFDTEEDYLDSLKQDDHYHFSIPFEYIEKNYGDGEYDIETAYMEVDVDWSSYDHGYKISYHCPDMSSIDPDEGNGDEDEFYDYWVEDKVLSELDSMGIGSEALYGGTGR